MSAKIWIKIRLKLVPTRPDSTRCHERVANTSETGTSLFSTRGFLTKPYFHVGNTIVLECDSTPNTVRVEGLKKVLVGWCEQVNNWVFIENVVTATCPGAVPGLSGVTPSPGIIFRCARLTIVKRVYLEGWF